ncbi:MAG: sugar porter family MFS transporter [Saprospiraceae bacterium]|nr:sugar porter family MFS transporter [Saprospiraceae bacterium]
MKNAQTIWIAAIVSLGGFLFGFDAAIISGVAGSVEALFDLNDLQVGWVVSSPSFSAMFAMLVAGSISNVLGRKKILIAVAFLYALSAFTSAYASSYEMLYLARMVGGLAFGAALVLAPLYIAEVSNAENRGKLVSIQQLNIVIGFSAAYFCSYYLNEASVGGTGMINEGNAWRWMLGVELLPALVYFFALFFIPNSPRWLLLKKKEAEAAEVLAKLHGEVYAKKELEDIKNSLADEQNSKQRPSLAELFHPSLRFVLLVGLTIGILQQITGINAIFFYATSIFEQTGIGTNAAFAQSVIVGLINVAATVLVMLLIDRMGRRPLLLIGIAGIAVSMLITSYGFNQATYQLTDEKINGLSNVNTELLRPIVDTEYDSDLAFVAAVKNVLGDSEFKKHRGDILQAATNMNAYLILFGILGFVASFAFSLGPIMWVMLSEMFPNKIRAVAIGLIGFVNSFVSWLIQQIFPWEISTLGNATTYLIFAIFAAVGFMILYKVLPETKGKTLEELERELVG